MPRNNLGGSRAKKQGNKHSGGPGGGGGGGRFAGVRRAADGEQYAVVTTVYGGGRALVAGNDGIQRRLEIRGKFKGRNRRHNEVRTGGLLLVGDRAWTINPSGANQRERVCDLLCVYDAEETRTLKREGRLQIAMLKEATSKFDGSDVEEDVSFDDAGGAQRADDVAAASDPESDLYPGMPSFGDEERGGDAIARPATPPPAASPARPRGLFDDDEDVDPDDI